MAESGYIRLHRAIWDHPVFRKEAFTEQQAFEWLISFAAWKPRQQRLGDHLIKLERGQVVGALRFLAENWRWSKSKVERFLERLKTEQMIETHTETGITIITVCNYDEYQGGEDDAGTAAGSGAGNVRDTAGTAPGQRRDNRKELNTLKEREEGEGQSVLSGDHAPPEKPKRPRKSSGATKLDPNFPLSDADRQYARERGWSDQKIEYQFQKWKDHHVGKGTRWEQWSKSWQLWVRNDFDAARDQRRGGPAVPSRADSAIDGLFSSIPPEGR